MFELVDVSRLDAAAALDLVEVAERTRRQAEVQRALAMLRVVRLYRHEIPTDKVQLGADGTSLVDDFACLELAAALHRDRLGVTVEVAELLTLQARHPQLWARTVDGQVPLWLARKIARTAWNLSRDAASWLDATVAPFTTRLGNSRLLAFVDALVTQADPAAANEASELARRGRRVIVDQSREGVSPIYGMLDAADAIYLDAALTQLADILAAQGSAETRDVRRATALGILATPARALALIQHALQPTLAAAPDAGSHDRGVSTSFEPADGPASAPDRASSTDPMEPAGLFAEPALAEALPVRAPERCAGHACGAITVHPDRLLPRATLVVHISEQTLDNGHGLARAERIGPLTLEHLQVLLHNKRITIQPVLDTAGIAAVDSYEIPARIRRAVILRQPWEVFPYSSRASRRLDLDHTIAYRWDGTPEQTAVGNLGPLTRKTHRAKTHAGWHLAQPTPGTYAWETPLGRRYVVAANGLTYSTGRSAPLTPSQTAGSRLLPDPPVAGRRRARGGRGDYRLNGV